MLLLGDCLQEMNRIPDGSIDMILCDLPYGTTACAWDSVIPFDALWAQYARISKRDANMVFTASQPFSTTLAASNLNSFRYSFVWEKQRPSNPQLAKFQPLKTHEDVLVFYKKFGTYNPQGVVAIPESERKISKPEKKFNRSLQKKTVYTNAYGVS